MALSDSRRVSRIGLGACMVAAPLLLAAGDLVDRSVNSDNDAKYVAQVAAHHKTHWLAGFLMLLGTLALLGAVIGIGHLSERASRHSRTSRVRWLQPERWR
jgi:hypothetical protein